MNHRLVCAFALVSSLGLLAGCATTQASRSTDQDEPTVAPRTLWDHSVPVVVQAPVPVVPPNWTTVAGGASDAALSLAELPADCLVTVDGALRSVSCPGWDVVVEVRDETPGTLDVDGLTTDTLRWFQARGAKVVMLASPDCNVGGRDAPCSFIEANSEDGPVGTGYVAVSDDGDRAFSLRCLYGSRGRELLLTDPGCRGLLRVALR